jgi:uncharacterized protein (DUF488 family)
MAGTIYTVGHSNLSADAFFATLAVPGIRTLADVRAIPASRRHPHFAREALAAACRERGIRYEWMPALGGRRRATTSASPHVAWELAAFRNYADYADRGEFAAALAALEDVAAGAPTAFMCAEALWWRCHRRLIADQLLVRGWEVLHIGSGAKPSPHRLPDFARVADGRILYDRGTTASLDLSAIDRDR